MEKKKRALKIISCVPLIIIVLSVTTINTFATGIVWDTATLGEYRNSNYDYSIMPYDSVGIQFGIANADMQTAESNFVYDITPSTFIPLSYWENFNNVAYGQLENLQPLDKDNIKYNLSTKIKPRTFTDWSASPYYDYNSIEYSFQFNPTSVTGNEDIGSPQYVYNNFYVRSSQIFIDLSEDFTQYKHYMFSTQTNSNNFSHGEARVQYDIVIPYVETVGTDTQFGFKKLKTVNSVRELRANTGYQIIQDSEINKEEIASAIGPNGTQFLEEYPIIITNISINLYTRLSYFASNPPIFYYTLSTPERPDYILNRNYDNWLFDVPTGSIIDFEDISWVDWFTTQIQSFLNIEFGLGLSIGVILFFVISVSLLFFFLKMFAGG